jgi:hypothetical protein
VKLHVAVLPDASVAVAVTIVVPFGNMEPEGGVETTLTPGQLSDAVTVKVTALEHCPIAAGMTILAGQVTVGACVSLTVTVNEQLAELPLASVTVQLTVVVPFGKVEPDGGLHVGEPTPGQLSLTVGAG